MRHTSGHTRNRRSHHALKVARFETCKDCNTKHLMHRACANCDKYRGRVVVDVLKKSAKKTASASASAPKSAPKKAPAKAKKEVKEKKPKEKKEKKSA